NAWIWFLAALALPRLNDSWAARSLAFRLFFSPAPKAVKLSTSAIKPSIVKRTVGVTAKTEVGPGPAATGAPMGVTAPVANAVRRDVVAASICHVDKLARGVHRH